MPLSAKDIRDTLHCLQYEGYRIEELEALLIHEDDFINLINSISSEQKYEITISQDAPSEIKVFGVKVIESRHIQPGSIFKIFKDDTKRNVRNPLNIFQNKVLPTADDLLPAVTGTIPFPESLRLSTVNEKIAGLNPAVVDEKKIEKRHSTTRKIELG